jgi:hypothetical protein
MKIFIDVGGHVGETVEAVLDSGYGFEKIYSFERSAPALTDRLGKQRKVRFERTPLESCA